jgi:hypothetical protein
MGLTKRIVAVAFLLIGLGHAGWARADTPRPLSEADLLKLVELMLDDDVIVARVEKVGVSFTVDDGAIERLRQGKASAAVLAAVRKAGKSAPVITYQSVLKLVELGIAEADIRKRLERSPTLFTLGKREEEELKKAGASDQLLAYLRGRQTQPARIGDTSNFVVILDCSGSMGDRTSEGPSKMEVAKKAVTELIESIPDGRNLAFIIYGHDAALKCEAVKVVQPLSELTAAARARLKKTIARLQPVGHTPIALSLRVAGKELDKARGLCGLILITDGMETCHGDPKAEAARLAKDPKLAFGFHVVGFDVDPREREAVRGIAEAGKGKAARGHFYDARSPAQLKKAMGRLVEIIVPERKEKREGANPALVKALIEQLNDRDGRVRRTAADTLGKLGAMEAVPALIQRVSDDVWLQRPWGSILGDTSPYDGIKDTGSKDRALQVLARLAPDRVEEALLLAMKSKSPAVQVWAILELAGQKKNEAIVASLVARLHDTNGFVRRAAADTLGKLEAKEAVPALIKRVADDVWWPRPFGTLLGDTNPYDGMPERGSKDRALQVLTKLAPDRIEEALLLAMKSKKSEVKAWAIKQLGKLEKK